MKNKIFIRDTLTNFKYQTILIQITKPIKKLKKKSLALNFLSLILNLSSRRRFKNLIYNSILDDKVYRNLIEEMFGPDDAMDRLGRSVSDCAAYI